MYVRVDRVSPSFATSVFMAGDDAANGDAHVINLMAKEVDTNGGLASHNAYEIVREIQLALGTAPTLTQEVNWTAYLNGGGTLQSVDDAFVGSDAFAARMNNGVTVDPHTVVTSTIMANMIQAAHAGANSDGTASQAQIDAWVGTGLNVDQVFHNFAQGDQFTAAIQDHAVVYMTGNINNYLDSVNHVYPSGDIFAM